MQDITYMLGGTNDVRPDGTRTFTVEDASKFLVGHWTRLYVPTDALDEVVRRIDGVTNADGTWPPFHEPFESALKRAQELTNRDDEDDDDHLAVITHMTCGRWHVNYVGLTSAEYLLDQVGTPGKCPWHDVSRFDDELGNTSTRVDAMIDHVARVWPFEALDLDNMPFLSTVDDVWRALVAALNSVPADKFTAWLGTPNGTLSGVTPLRWLAARKPQSKLLAAAAELNERHPS